MRKLKLATISRTDEEIGGKSGHGARRNVRWKSQKKTQRSVPSMQRMNAEQRVIMHKEILFMRKEALRKQKLKRNEQELPQDCDENFFDSDEGEEDKDVAESLETMRLSAAHHDITETRTKYTLKLFGGNPSSCAEAKCRFDRVHSSIENLKDSINPDRVELRRVEARMKDFDGVDKDRIRILPQRSSSSSSSSSRSKSNDERRDFTRDRIGEKSIPSPAAVAAATVAAADADVSKTSLRLIANESQEAAGKKKSNDPVVEIQDNSAEHIVDVPNVDADLPQKKSLFITSEDAVDDDFMHGDVRSTKEAREWIEKLRAVVREERDKIFSLKKTLSDETKRVTSFYRRCKQIERERDEWKDLYGREVSQRLQTSTFEKEKERLLEQISNLKSKMRELQSGTSATAAGSKIGSRRGSNYFVDAKNLERTMSRLRQAKQECDAYRELYKSECQKNGTQPLSPHEVQTTPSSSRSLMSSVDSPLSFSTHARRGGRNLAEPRALFPGVSS